jgi:uncharacterized protein DUF6745
MGVTRVDGLTDEQRARFDDWADRWVEIGLRTGAADRERFEAAMRDCYRYAGLDWPGAVVWVPSPLELALAAPAAAYAIETHEPALQRRLPSGGAVGEAVACAVAGAVRDGVERAVDRVVGGTIAVEVGGIIDGAVHGAVGDPVGGAVADAVRAAAITSPYLRDTGGQFWSTGWGTPFQTSFLREVCGLELPGDLWDRARAFEATAESACCWWLHGRFVMACERPLEIHRELADARRPRGWGSHRLHRDDGPAVVWPDGWGVWSIHGVRVPREVVEAPATLTVGRISGDENAEIRRIMIDRYGTDRYVRGIGGRVIDDDPEWGRLWRTGEDGGEPLLMVEVINSTPEPNGSSKTYWLRVPPHVRTAHEAVAWTFDVPPGDYQLQAQT